MSRKELTSISPENRVNLREHVQAIRAGAPINLEKKDFMALTALAIEEVWEEVDRWRKQHGDALPQRIGDKHVFKAAPKDYFCEEKYPEDVLPLIRSNFMAFFQAELEIWLQKQQSMMKKNAGEKDADKEERYALLEKCIQYKNVRTNAKEHVMAGFGTASRVILEVMRLIPHVYRYQYREQISADQLRRIAWDARKLILIMASMGLQGFLDLDDLLAVGDKDQFAIQKFHLREKGQGKDAQLALEIEKQVLVELRQKARHREEVTGCPALAVEGSEGKNVVAEYFDWLYHVADMYYFSLFEKK